MHYGPRIVVVHLACSEPADDVHGGLVSRVAASAHKHRQKEGHNHVFLDHVLETSQDHATKGLYDHQAAKHADTLLEDTNRHAQPQPLLDIGPPRLVVFIVVWRCEGTTRF